MKDRILDKEPDTLICAPICEADTDDMVPGTQIRYCSLCRTEVFIAPGGQKLVAERGKGIVIACTHCAMRRMKEQQADGQKIEVSLADENEWKESP